VFLLTYLHTYTGSLQVFDVEKHLSTTVNKTCSTTARD